MSIFTEKSGERLFEKTGYEKWLSLYLQNKRFQYKRGSKIYEIKNGVHVFVNQKEVIGEGSVNEVIDSLAPLVFISSFKLLDMICEWILEIYEDNGMIKLQSTKLKFDEKSRLIKKLDTAFLPKTLMAHNFWYRLTSLYDNLLPFRHAIIHNPPNSSYDIPNGILQITNEDKGILKLTVDRLYALSHVLMCFVALLETNAATIDVKAERAIKSAFDLLDDIHRKGVYGVKPPSGELIIIRLEAIETPNKDTLWQVDLPGIWREFRTMSPDSEDFTLLILGMKKGRSALSWVIPSECLPESMITLTEYDHTWSQFMTRV
jgi:hypothetical protein